MGQGRRAVVSISRAIPFRLKAIAAPRSARGIRVALLLLLLRRLLLPFIEEEVFGEDGVT